MTSFNNSTLYYRPLCPCCIRVKRFLSNNNIILNEKDISEGTKVLSELVYLGGKRQMSAIADQNFPQSIYQYLRTRCRDLPLSKNTLDN